MKDRRVAFIGPIPPPVTGMTLATRIVLEELQHRCSLLVMNTSHPRYYPGLRWKAIKGLRTAVGLPRLLMASMPRGSSVYLVPNASAGLWYDIAIATVARLSGHQLFVHHQVYSYVAQHDPRMARLNRLMRPTDCHIMLCPEMVGRFRQLYPEDRRFLVLPNSIVALSQTPNDAQRPRTPLRLGHLSNLTVEKGLDLVLETFRRLRSDGANVNLVLAGPARSEEASQLVSSASQHFGSAIDYRGPVYGEHKSRFYHDIDVLLFPTKYRNEAYPLVICEALGFGVPVIAYGRACIPHVVGDSGGLCVPPNEDFVEPAAEQVSRWLADPTQYARSLRRVRDRRHEMRFDAKAKLEFALRAISRTVA